MKDIYTTKYNVLISDTIVVVRNIRTQEYYEVAKGTYEDIMCDCYEGSCRPNDNKIDRYFRRKIK